MTFSSGTFYPATYLTIPASKSITLEGMGPSTIVNFDKGDLSSSNRHLFTNYNGSTRNNITNIHFKNMKFVDENNSSATAPSIAIGTGNTNDDSSNTNISVVDCEFDHCAIRLANVNAGQALVKNCYVHDISGYETTNAGIMFYRNDAHSVLDSCIVDTVYKMAVGSIGCTNVQYTNNFCHDTAQGESGYSLTTDECTRIKIVGNIVDSSRGILCEDDYGQIVISGNLVVGILTEAIGIGVWQNHSDNPLPEKVVITGNCVYYFDWGIWVDSVVDAIIANNKVVETGQWGIGVMNTNSKSIRKFYVAFNDVFKIARSVDNGAGIKIGVDYADVIGNTVDGDLDSQDHNASGILGNNGDQSHSRFILNDIKGCHAAGYVFRQIGSGAEIWANKGYIGPLETKRVTGSLTAGGANDIAFAWHNTEGNDIRVAKVMIRVVTPSISAGSVLDVGIADDVNGTNLGTEFFNDLDLTATGNRDSWVTGDGGAQTEFVLCDDSFATTNGWVVGKILTAAAAALEGTYWIEYVDGAITAAAQMALRTPTPFLDNTALGTNGEFGKGITSNAFFDHVASASPHAAIKLDWDDVWTDAVHTHASDAEGGLLDWDNCWTDAVHEHDSDAHGGTLNGSIWVDNAISRCASENASISYRGGYTYSPKMTVYGKDHATLPGTIYFEAPNAAEGAWVPVMHLEGCSDTPGIYVNNNASFGTHSDRTPWFKGDALEALRGVKGSEDGQIDKTTLPESLKIRVERDGVVEEERNLSATISALTVAVQQLAERLEDVERRTP